MTEPHLAQPVLTTPEKPMWWKNRKFWTVVGVILAIALAAASASETCGLSASASE